MYWKLGMSEKEAEDALKIQVKSPQIFISCDTNPRQSHPEIPRSNLRWDREPGVMMLRGAESGLEFDYLRSDRKHSTGCKTAISASDLRISVLLGFGSVIM